MTGDLSEQPSRAEERQREDVARAFREVFALDAGKRVLFWMLEQSAIYQDAYTGKDNATNYTLGLQAGGRRLIAKLDEIDPRLYPALLMAVADLRAMDKAAIERADLENDDAEDA